MIAAYVADTDALGLGRPDHEPRATETIGPIVELIEALIERGHAYESGGDVYFRVRSFDAYGRLSNRDPDDDGPGRGGRRRRAQGGAARLRALEGAQGGRGHVLAEPVGRRAARLAHRVLGDGGGAARPRVRDPRRRLRPRLPAPRERDRPDRGGARAGRWPGSGCTTGWSRPAPTRRCRSRSGNIFLLGEAIDAYGAEAVVGFLVSGHYRQPIAFGERALRAVRGRATSGSASSSAAGPASRTGERDRGGRGARARPSSTRSPTTSTPRGRWPSSSR